MSRRGLTRSPLSLFVAIAVILAMSSLFGVMAQAEPAKAAVAINRDHIRNIIYPTLGYPSITPCGDTLTVEYDPRNQDWSQGLPTLMDFRASITTTNSAYPVTRTLEPLSFEVGYSSHWPEYSESAQPNAKIYIVTFRIPESVPVHLYDMTMSGKKLDGTWMADDSQPHALQTVVQYKTDFKYAQLTDIHVWGPEAHYPGSYPTHERNYRHENYSETDGYGATYYHKTIQQMNREKPDFIVYTGDYDFSQKWLYQQNYGSFDQYKNTPWDGSYYEPWFEMDWFYQETMALDVPVFITPGNHDSYARYDLFNINLEEDYMASWRNLFGPQYYSFDYGPADGSGYHFTSMNTMDWTPKERNLHWGIPNVILVPGKWQGQLSGGGDAFAAGWSQPREDAIDESKLTGQLLWAKQDLQAHAGAAMRTVVIHCDPWKDQGTGSMFDNADMFNIIKMGGKGAGRLALIKLARENHVSLILSGHDHSDCYGEISWEGGGPAGTLRSVNTTSTMFQDSSDGTNMWVYPGYRMISVNGGTVINYYYTEAPEASGGPAIKVSWPSYAGTNVGGPSNFNNMNNAAVQSAWTGQPGTDQNVSCDVINYLCGREITPGGDRSGDIKNAGIEFPMPTLTGGYYYTVTNGTFSEIFDTTGHRVYEVSSDIPHASSEGSSISKMVSVNKSLTSDKTPPTCTSFQINGGAPTTDVADVIITNDATDSQSGMLDMKVWNDTDSESLAQWQRWEPSTEWHLNETAGLRTVHIRFRDAAMPGNESGEYSATITMVGNPPAITNVSPNPAHVGDTVTITGTDFGAPQSPHDKVEFNNLLADVTSWAVTSIQCVVPDGAYSDPAGIEVTTDAGTTAHGFQVLPTITSMNPPFGYNNGTVDITNMEGTGFYYVPGGAPTVKLVNGGTEIVATNVVVNGADSISCRFDLANPTAAVGYWDVYVQNTDGGVYTLHNGFEVKYPPPTVSGVDPAGGNNDQIVDVAITGGLFREGVDAALESGSTLIMAANPVFVDANNMTCTFDLNGAPPGEYDLVVMNNDGETGTLPGGFEIEYPAPTVTAVTPASAMNTGPVGITDLAGTGFRDGATVTLTGAGTADIPATGVTVVSANKITCSVDLTGAATGVYDVKVVNDDTKEGVLPGGFDVNGKPVLTGISPASGAVGTQVTLTGRDFGAAPGNGSVTFGGVAATDIVSWSDGTIEAIVPAGACTGPVVVTNGTAVGNNDRSFRVMSPTWYLAEGSTDHGFSTYISIENPQDEALNADVTYLRSDGTSLHTMVGLPARSQVTVNPMTTVGIADFSTKIDCQQGKNIAVDRTMSWTGPGAASPEGHNSIGVTSPSRGWFMAEGCSTFGFETWLLVGNTSLWPATCRVTYMIEGEAPVTLTKTVPPASRASFSMRDDIGEKNAAIKVESDVPVVAERSMYRNNRREGHNSVGMILPGVNVYLAEGSTAWGFTTYVLLSNPNAEAANVTLTWMTPGGPIAQPSFVMPPLSRKTVRVNDSLKNSDVSTIVSSDRPVVAERSMYWTTATGEACHDSVGVDQSHSVVYLPDGQTSSGRETYTLVQNPNDSEVQVEIDYLVAGGSYTVSFLATVPAMSRLTFNMADRLPSGRASIVVKSMTPGKKIMAERSMYWNSRGAGTESIGGYSD